MIQFRFSNITNEVHVGDLVEAMLVLDDVKLTSEAQEIVNGCVTWTPSPPFRAFLESFVLAVEKFMTESKHISTTVEVAPKKTKPGLARHCQDS